MSTELTGTATYRATVTAPVDGDTRNAASVQAGLQDCADSLAFHDGVLKGTTAWPTLGDTLKIQSGSYGSGASGILQVNTASTQFAKTVFFQGGLYSSTAIATNGDVILDFSNLIFLNTSKPVYRLRTLTDANATLNISVGDIWRMPTGTLTANRTFILGATGAVAGCRMTVTRWNDAGAFSCLIQDTAGAGLITLTTAVLGAEFVHTGTDWVVIGRYT